MSRKELALLLVSAGVTIAVALGLVRWLAPGLLGGPKDLRLVATGEQLPAFYEGVFRADEFKTADFLLKDPRTLNRPRPFHSEIVPLAIGPHDVLGFRNRAVPAVADVVTIGDSQTYGINVLLEDNWPSELARRLGGRSVYSMAAGSWGAVQYADMFLDALAFRPYAIVVAIYTGNDAIDSFQLAYGSETWRALRSDPHLSQADLPELGDLSKPEEWWTATFKNGAALRFTPKLRLLANAAQPAVDAGYGVIAKALELMAQSARQNGVRLVVTVVPTKETVYAPRVRAEGLAAPPEYSALVGAEGGRIAALAQAVQRLQVTYVDVVAPLQKAALEDADLYPVSANGHPDEGGYRVIGAAVAAALAPLLPPRPEGWVQLEMENGQHGSDYVLVRDGAAWVFPTRELVEANGWRGVTPARVPARALAGLPKRVVGGVDRAHFGPRR